VNPNDYNAMVRLAQYLSGQGQTYAVGTPTSLPSNNPCGNGNGSGGGTPPTGGGGGDNCGAQFDYPYYSVKYRAPSGAVGYYQHYCCPSTANAIRNQLAAQNPRYAIWVETNYYVWRSNPRCSQYQLTCRNGIAALALNGTASIPGRCP
jgi:hypothetical protein